MSAPRGSFTLARTGARWSCSARGWERRRCWRCCTRSRNRPSAPPVWWLLRGAQRRGASLRARIAGPPPATPGSRRFVAYSRPAAADRPGEDFDAVGHLGFPDLEGLGVPRDANFYLCGPTAFLHELGAGLAAWGAAGRPCAHGGLRRRPIDHAGLVQAKKRPPHPPPGPPGSGPRVSFVRSGLTVPWDPSCGSLLELAEACDVPVRWSCRTGVCHTCETALVAGRVAFDPEPIDRPAEGNTLTCCSRPAGDVDLDL